MARYNRSKLWLLGLQVVFCGYLFFAFSGGAFAQGAPRANSFFVLPTGDIASLHKLVADLHSYGGRADHIFPPNTLIGYIRPESEAELRMAMPLCQLRPGPDGRQSVGLVPANDSGKPGQWNL